MEIEKKNIWFTSDTHFFHSQEFLYGDRGFTSAEEMTKKLVENWNSVVAPEDEVYHLGDVMLNDTEKGIEVLKKLNGKIHIIRGNHDSDQRAAAYLECPNVVDVQWATMLKYKKRMFYLTHYPTCVGNFDDNKKIWCLCGHSHTQNKFIDMDKKCYHVELDCHNLYPVSFEQIIKDIQEKREEVNNKNEK